MANNNPDKNNKYKGYSDILDDGCPEPFDPNLLPKKRKKYEEELKKIEKKFSYNPPKNKEKKPKNIDSKIIKLPLNYQNNTSQPPENHLIPTTEEIFNQQETLAPEKENSQHIFNIIDKELPALTESIQPLKKQMKKFADLFLEEKNQQIRESVRLQHDITRDILDLSEQKIRIINELAASTDKIAATITKQISINASKKLLSNSENSLWDNQIFDKTITDIGDRLSERYMGPIIRNITKETIEDIYFSTLIDSNKLSEQKAGELSEEIDIWVDQKWLNLRLENCINKIRKNSGNNIVYLETIISPEYDNIQNGIDNIVQHPETKERKVNEIKGFSKPYTLKDRAITFFQEAYKILLNGQDPLQKKLYLLLKKLHDFRHKHRLYELSNHLAKIDEASDQSVLSTLGLVQDTLDHLEKLAEKQINKHTSLLEAENIDTCLNELKQTQQKHEQLKKDRQKSGHPLHILKEK